MVLVCGFQKKVWSTTSSSIMPCLTALSTVIKKPKKNLEISLPKNNTFLLKFFLFQYYPSIFLLFFFLGIVPVQVLLNITLVFFFFGMKFLLCSVFRVISVKSSLVFFLFFFLFFYFF